MTLHPGKTHTNATNCLKIRQCESICASPTTTATRRGWLVRAGMRAMEPGGRMPIIRTPVAAGCARRQPLRELRRGPGPTRGCRADASMSFHGCNASMRNNAAIRNNCVYSAPAYKAGQTDPAQQIRGSTWAEPSPLNPKSAKRLDQRASLRRRPGRNGGPQSGWANPGTRYGPVDAEYTLTPPAPPHEFDAK